MESNNKPSNSIKLNNIKSDFFTDKSWKRKRKRKTKIISENEQLAIASTSKKVNYITFLEHNTNFSSISNKTRLISMKGDYTFNIESTKSGRIKVIIYLIEYDASFQKIKNNKISVNGRTIIKSSQATEYARIAIRIEGEGELHIKSLDVVNYINEIEDFNQLPYMKDLNVAGILDEFSYESFKDIVNLITFSPFNWKEILHKNKPDLLIIESAWKGNSGTWQYEIGNYSNNSNNARLRDLVAWCKRNRVPTVFWNKEDPVHFEKFTKAASLVDYVFTTDADSIPKYRDLLGHNRVDYLQFAANPVIHNPISLKKEKISKICFAGSYYANRHEERKKDMDEILDMSNDLGLHIYDRNYYVNQTNENSHFRFPEHLQSNVIGTLKYEEMEKAYKEYRLTMNVNSVKHSPTMFSRRVFESLACGTPVISSYATGIKKLFQDIVPLLDDSDTTFQNEVKKLMTDDTYYRELSLRGMRKVFSEHTYEDRMEKILNKLNFQYCRNQYDVTLVFTINEPYEIEQAIDIMNNQSYKNTKAIFLVNYYDNVEEILNNYNNGRISSYLIDYAYKYESLDKIISTSHVIRMRLSNKYGKYFIEDLINASRYSQADVIGKKNIKAWKENAAYLPYEYEYVESVEVDTALFKLSTIKSFGLYEFINELEAIMDKLFRARGCRIFSSDRFNFNEDTEVSK
ncbi:spore maturation protein CgeB [Gracilibacillus halotolerans]|uniref:Spore maturation protein CgeB n=1 Tax=Gracilibacillus halotolerans TaxID=74386 RepID=A0A841RSP0_9BACI|nr:glycosyltransferase [Gracilibacillus halotolerans]MBB6513588.1 spore maturation protein CgeB [Gracilibacillus halotolerans]